MHKHLNIVVKSLFFIWLLLVSASTLLVYQHHFIDLPTGALMGAAALYFISAKRGHFLSRRFTTPRGVKVGYYFLFGAIASMIASFALSPLFLWLFVSLFSISIIFAFGLNSLLAGKDAKPALWQKILFFPYFLGSYLSWIYYKRNLSLMVEVEKNVHFGRRPTKDEHTIIKKKNLNNIINLAVEQQCFTQKDDTITRLPYLDQTIQSPESLHKGVLMIEAKKEDGVYVHCALGLSRSILLISAWMLYNKHTLEEIEAQLKILRPKYVKSAYMKITLEIYQEYLISLN